MNKERRKHLNSLQDRLIKLHSTVVELIQEYKQLGEDLESLRDEEQESFDNLPESLQSGEKGTDIQFAIDNLTEACDGVSEIIDGIEGPVIDEIIEKIEDAKGEA